ncbi:MAG: MFS transporter, partial [Stellaceae bacterium]
QYTATQAIGYADIEQPQMSSATSIASMSQQLSRGFGIALAAAVLNWSLAARGASALGTVDFMVAFSAAACVALCNLPFGWVLRHDAAASVSGHRAEIRDRIA